MEEIDRQLFLDFKDRYVLAGKRNGPHLHVDFLPFYDYSPSIRDTRTIGNDIRFLNRYMCSSIFSRPDEWNTKLFNFIKLHKYNGRQLLVNGIKRVQEHFNWRLYSRRLINLTKLYGFWRYSVSGKGKIKLDRYCDFLHHFLIRERALQMT